MSTSEPLSYDCCAPSEDVLERELQNALIRGGGRDRAEIRAIHRGDRKPELDPVIDVEEAGPDECVVRHISVRASTGQAERRGVQPLESLLQICVAERLVRPLI